MASEEIATLAANVAGYDPHLALDGGPDGLDAYRQIAARTRRVLAAQGRLFLEIGPTQADAVAAILGDAGLKPEIGVPDLAGRPRVVVARR